ncbi:MAG: tetratricopeptide repeat protein [Pseudanabaenales cyanobacterium]|nr:tetratricopeptide repeat protein [Pseudanabaenales cyanobacterium]
MRLPRRAISAGLSLTLSWGLLSLTTLPAAAQGAGGNYISEIQGQAELKSAGQDNFQRAYAGDPLRAPDQLRVSAGSTVDVVCNNIRLHTLAAGTYTISDYCNTEGPISLPSSRRPARDFNANLPYVLRPRNTALLEAPQPTIRWNPVDGAQSYEVRVSGPDGQWTTDVSDTEVIYDGPALQPDIRYRIVITANNDLSSSPDVPVGFTLLSMEEAARVKDQVAQLLALPQNADAAAIGLALLYQSYMHSNPAQHSNALNQAALDVLQKRIDDGTENSQIYLLQGDIYLAVGLPLKAQKQYEQALELAMEAEQLTRQADSYEGLATVAQGESEVSDAISHLKSALRIYETLGNVTQVNALQERIDRLQLQL